MQQQNLKVSDNAKNLDKLRELMKKKDISAFIIPTQDAHQSEYVSNFDKRREFITNFTGSAGTALVTLAIKDENGNEIKQRSLCWTDGRYWDQFPIQTKNTEWELMKIYKDSPMETWLAENIKGKHNIGVDPYLISVDDFMKQKEYFESYTQLKLVPVSPNIIDEIWENKPKAPHGKIFPLPLKFSGLDHHSKISKVQEYLVKNEMDGIVITALDEIAWLLNLRGADVDFNPVFWSYVYVDRESTTLYVDETKFEDNVIPHLGSNVKVKAYESFVKDLTLNSDIEGKIISVDPSSCNLAVFNALESSKVIVAFKDSPILTAKAIKNSTELDGFRNCHIRDGVALVKFFCWLEEAILDPNANLTEVSVSDRLEEFRKEGEHFVSLSFDTIAGSGPSGSIIHYKPEKETCLKIDPNDMFLLDSGAQYLDGTTDVTRTIHLGTPSEYHRECFTRVLKGHIALDRIIFIRGTTGYKLDSFARAPLWEVGLDYRHGTGHGVGSFLNVHEGPHGIGTKPSSNEFSLKPGMTVTNEPGYYEENSFGIRIENVMIVIEAKTKHNFGGQNNTSNYLGFEHVTYAPLQHKLIDTSLLTKQEIEWVNNYHKECYEKLSTLLDKEKDKKVLDWLKRNTEPIN